MSSIAAVAAICLIAGGVIGQTEFESPTCDPEASEEPCCPVHGMHFTIDYADWRACVPVERLPVEVDHD